MTPRELLQTICPRILNTVETELFDKIPSLPNEVKRAMQQQVKEIRLCIFRECDIHPWTREESQQTTVPNKKERPERNTKKVSPPQAKPSTTPQLDEFDRMPANDSYARNASPVNRVAIFKEAQRKKFR